MNIVFSGTETLLHYVLMNKIFSILCICLQIAQISAQDDNPSHLPKNEIVKKTTQVVLQNDKEYPYFFKYDSIVFLNGVSKTQILKINNYLQSDFRSFVNANNNVKITYNAQKNLTNCIDNSELYMQHHTYIIDHTSTYINIGNINSWCCRRNGLQGYNAKPPYTIAIKTLKPIELNTIFLDGFKEILINHIRKHPKLKNFEEDGKVIKQYICEDDKKDYLLQKVENATTTQEIIITPVGIYVNTQEVTYCSEMDKYRYDTLEIGANFSEVKGFIKPDNPYVLKF